MAASNNGSEFLFRRILSMLSNIETHLSRKVLSGESTAADRVMLFKIEQLIHDHLTSNSSTEDR